MSSAVNMANSLIAVTLDSTWQVFTNPPLRRGPFSEVFKFLQRSKIGQFNKTLRNGHDTIRKRCIFGQKSKSKNPGKCPKLSCLISVFSAKTLFLQLFYKKVSFLLKISDFWRIYTVERFSKSYFYLCVSAILP